MSRHKPIALIVFTSIASCASPRDVEREHFLDYAHNQRANIVSATASSFRALDVCISVQGDSAEKSARTLVMLFSAIRNSPQAYFVARAHNGAMCNLLPADGPNATHERTEDDGRLTSYPQPQISTVNESGCWTSTCTVSLFSTCGSTDLLRTIAFSKSNPTNSKLLLSPGLDFDTSIVNIANTNHAE